MTAKPPGDSEHHAHPPFWPKDEGWTAAEFLSAGNVIELHDGAEGEILSAADTGATDTVHNFEVDGFHTYYVGQRGVWVHNTDCFTTGRRAARKSS